MNEAINMMHSLDVVDGWREKHAGDKAAMALSERIKQCIVFLFTIERIEVVDTLKNARNGDTCYVINVIVSDPQNKNDAAATATTGFQIQRTFKEFKELHHVTEHWSKKHPKSGCAYCKYFQSAGLPGGGLSRLTKSKEKMERQLQEFLGQHVFNARLSRPTEKECQGFDHIPSVVTRFLTKDLPPPDAQDEEQQEQQGEEQGKPADVEASQDTKIGL